MADHDRRYIALRPRHAELARLAGDWCGGTRSLAEVPKPTETERDGSEMVLTQQKQQQQPEQRQRKQSRGSWVEAYLNRHDPAEGVLGG